MSAGGGVDSAGSGTGLPPVFPVASTSSVFPLRGIAGPSPLSRSTTDMTSALRVSPKSGSSVAPGALLSINTPPGTPHTGSSVPERRGRGSGSGSGSGMGVDAAADASGSGAPAPEAVRAVVIAPRSGKAAEGASGMSPFLSRLGFNFSLSSKGDLASMGKGSANGSSPSLNGAAGGSLTPVGSPPLRVDTDEDLLHKQVLWEIDRAEIDWERGIRLGVGAYGEVWRARWRGTDVAVKKVNLKGGNGNTAVQELRHEIAVMSHMHHPRVVQFLGACTRGQPWLIVFEFLTGGALSAILEKRTQPLSHVVAGRWAIDTVQGLRYLHEHKPTPVVHRDLKPNNLLIDASGHLKISDFGLAKIMDIVKVLDERYVMTGETGSYRYMAPEVFRHEKYSEKVDIYSLGCILFYLFHGEPPFNGINPVQAASAAALEHTRPTLRANLDPRIAAIIQGCWHPLPEERPSAQRVSEELERIFPPEVARDPTGESVCCSVA